MQQYLHELVGACSVCILSCEIGGDFMFRKRALGRINHGFVLVTVDEREKNVSFKTQGQEVTVRDLIENNHIFSLLIRTCYGAKDDNMVKKIWLDSCVSEHRPITPAIVSALIDEYYGEEINKKYPS